jgi:hypothetical protein
MDMEGPAQIGKIRRSETFEQQQHENEVLRNQFSNLDVSSTDDTDRDEKTDKPKGFGSKLKGMWDSSVKSAFPDAVEDLKSFRESLSVEARIKKDMTDSTIFPEVQHVAEVRKGAGLSHEEYEFLHARRMHVQQRFARYIGVDPAEVHPDDVPTISFGGSELSVKTWISCRADSGHRDDILGPLNSRAHNHRKRRRISSHAGHPWLLSRDEEGWTLGSLYLCGRSLWLMLVFGRILHFRVHRFSASH